MSRIRRLFTFKCVKGHVMEKTYPIGTRLDDYDETTCTECLNASEVKPAYLVFARDKSEKEQGNGGIHS